MIKEDGPFVDAAVVDYLRAGAAYLRLPTLSVRFVDGDGCIAAVDPHAAESPGGEVYKHGSISKLVTAIAALQLAEEGAMDLDDPVSDYLPWFPWPRTLDSLPCPTVRSLLLHTAGLPRGVFLDGTPTRDQVRGLLESDQAWLRTPSGQQTAAYSNLGYVLLGWIVEAAGAGFYESLAAKRIFEPVGMSSAGFGLPPADRPFAPPRQLTCFRDANRSPFEHAPMRPIIGPSAAMSLHATLDDLARLVACLIRCRSGTGEHPIPARTIARLFSQRSGRSGGMGLRFASGPCGALAMEAAEDFGHSTALLIALDHGIGAAAATNRASAGIDLLHLILAVMRHRLLGDDAPPLSHAPLAAGRLVGRYFRGDGKAFTIQAEGDGLSGALDGEPQSKIVAQGPDGLLITGGSMGKYPMTMDRSSRGLRAICAGPHRLCRDPRDARTPDRHAAHVGIYEKAATGRVAVFERGQSLFIAYSPMKETLLDPVSDRIFVQSNGPFTGERVHFDPTVGIMSAGGLTFRKTKEVY